MTSDQFGEGWGAQDCFSDNKKICSIEFLTTNYQRILETFLLEIPTILFQERVKPKSIADADMAEMLKSDNHFFACLSYINKVKTGPFHEHSNQLWNISGVPLWSKVYTGANYVQFVAA